MHVPRRFIFSVWSVSQFILFLNKCKHCSISNFNRLCIFCSRPTQLRVHLPVSMLSRFLLHSLTPQIQWVSRWHCALYKLNLLIYILIKNRFRDSRQSWNNWTWQIIVVLCFMKARVIKENDRRWFSLYTP